jgi:EAL domain-containing protein (putative c-di-GMP-specific phosphodiesterase class I)
MFKELINLGVGYSQGYYFGKSEVRLIKED